MNGHSSLAIALHAAGTPESLLTRSLADALATRITAALEGRYAALEPWLFGTVARYAHLPGVRAVVAYAGALVTEQSPRGAPAAAVEAVAQMLTAFADADAARPPDLPQPLDPIDAKIDELILRLDLQDPLTAEHSRAVAAWCTHLARTLGLNEAEVAFAARSGLVHDVGKLEVPIEVLNAPRFLNRDEWTIMRSHAARGAALVLESEALETLNGPVRSHHERIDGLGYPDGLAGDDIPLFARLVAVADCFNAMIGRRPYRPPLTPSAAIAELRRNAGSQFDPDVVRAMLAVLNFDGG